MKLEQLVSPRTVRKFRRLKYDQARRRYSSWRHHAKESHTYIAIMFALARGICPLCGATMVLRFDNYQGNDLATLDHENTLDETMQHDKLNLMLLCKGCNNQRGNSKTNGLQKMKEDYELSEMQ